MPALDKAPRTTIEFIPQEGWEKTSFGKFLKWLLNIGRWIVIVTELIVILAFLSRFKLDRDLTNLNETVKQKQAIVNASADFEKEFRFLQKRLSTIEGLKKNQLEVDKILDIFSQVTPAGIQLSNFNFSGEKISLTAMADSEITFAVFLKNLKQEPKLTNLSLGRVTTGEAQIGQTVFNLTAELKN